MVSGIIYVKIYILWVNVEVLFAVVVKVYCLVCDQRPRKLSTVSVSRLNHFLK